MYSQSWIGLYYGYDATINSSNIVSFYNTKSQSTVVETNRFYVNTWFSDSQTQTYFFPSSAWDNIGPSLLPGLLVFRTESLSQVPHGMITDGYPYTKSPYYKSPFFLTFKTDHSISSNFLTFNNFLIPNSYGRILCMLTYDDESDKFMPVFKTDFVLPYQNTLSLNSVLEFHIYDAEKKLVQFLDLCQLYIQVEVFKQN